MSRAGTLVRSDFLMMGTRGSGTKSGMARVARISSAWVQDFPRYPEAWLAAWACTWLRWDVIETEVRATDGVGYLPLPVESDGSLPSRRHVGLIAVVRRRVLGKTCR